MELSRIERLLLANQYKILSLLREHPDDVAEYDMRLEAVEKGYRAAYEDVLLKDIADEFNETQCLFVKEAIALYGIMQRSYDNLEDKAGIEESSIRFPGFDGNDEYTHMAYARYLVEKQGWYRSLRAEPNFDSHEPMLGRYQSQNNRWQLMGKKTNLTPDDINTILEAR